MPITITFSDTEARDLAEMLSLTAMIASDNQQDSARARLTDWGKLIGRCMKELSETPKLKGKIEYSEEIGAHLFTKEYEETAFFQDCLDEHRDSAFWADLVTRLADKALSEHLGEECFDMLTEEARRRMAEPMEKALWHECACFGIDRLGFILPPEEA